MVTVVVIEFSVMRCQPLRRALGVHRSSCEITKNKRKKFKYPFT
ncbi:acetyltransferase [Vibrio mimicus]